MLNRRKIENVVLNLSHLSFGFQISFFALYGSFLVFLIELIIFWVLKRKKIIEKVDVFKYYINSHLIVVKGILKASNTLLVFDCTDERSSDNTNTNLEIESRLSIIDMERVFGDKVELLRF